MKRRTIGLLLAAVTGSMFAAAGQGAGTLRLIQVDELGNMVVTDTGDVVTIYSHRSSLISDVGLPGSRTTATGNDILAYDLSGIVSGLTSGDFVIHEKSDENGGEGHSDVIRFLPEGTFGSFVSTHDQLLFYSDDEPAGIPLVTDTDHSQLLANFIDDTKNKESQGAGGEIKCQWNPSSSTEPGAITNSEADGHWEFWSEGTVPEPSGVILVLGGLGIVAGKRWRRID